MWLQCQALIISEKREVGYYRISLLTDLLGCYGFIPFQLLGLPSNVCMFAFMNLSITQSFAMESSSEYWGGPQMLCFGSISAIIYGQMLVRKIIPWM